ncbi:MAG: serine/threonine protein kinase [Polyangiales bacterium]
MLRQLDKYELLEEIGHGGMATVYKARDSRLDRLVAVKVLHPHLQKTPEARSRFTREAQSVAKLKHGGILEIYDYSGDDSPESYIAAELLTGPTLKVFIEDEGKALPAEVAAAFTIQIARALGAAHAAKIVHRDVKPENVLLHENIKLKLTDFGIAQMVDSQSMTATGQILGSPGHMAPEQVAAGDVDERSDIFSLGTVLYYLATGRLPFQGRNPHQILKRIVDGDFPEPLRINPAMGGELAGILRRTMSVEPSERQDGVDSLEAELQRFLLGLDIEDSDALVREYLADKKATRERLRENAIRVLLRRGAKAVGAGARSEAMECLDRVLALDEGNEEAMALVGKLGKERSLAAPLIAIGVALALGVGGYAVSTMDEGGGEEVISRLDDAGVDALADTGLDDASDAGEVDADEADEVDAGEEADSGEADAEEADTGVDARRPRRDARPRPRGPRRVVFRPSPPRVSISVDGSPPRDFGPSFNSIELDPGSHRFRIVGECCIEEDFSVSIPGGNDDYILRRTLDYKPANLIVHSAVSATVEVSGRGTARASRGTTGILFPVALSEARQRRTVIVRAPGYVPLTLQLDLGVGAVVSRRVQLVPIPSENGEKP